MKPLELPGFYYDPEKKKYFKIQSSNTGPGADWSADNVKRRKIAAQEAAAALEQAKGRIVRSKVLNNPLTGGFLAREHGVPKQDVYEACFAKGLVDKGVMPLADARWGHGFNINALCITAEDKSTGLGVGFASADGQCVMSTYIPRDKHGRIHRQLLTKYRTPGNQVRPYQELHLSEVSDIKFQSSSGFIIVAHHSLTDGASLRALRLDCNPQDSDPMVPYWALGAHQGIRTAAAYQAEGRVGYLANAVAPSPSGPDTLCAVASAQGLLECKTLRGLDWVSPQSWATKRKQAENPYRDLFAVDYRKGDNNTVITGGRPQICYLFDTRFSPESPEPLCFQHPSSITHIKSLDEHTVLVSGIQNTMRIYDLRKPMQSFCENDAMTQAGHIKEGHAVVKFSDYKNSAHLRHGLDVDVETGIVAVSNDDGSIAIHSLKTGLQLSCLRAPSPHSGVVQALQFQTMVGDHTPSLFAGIGSNIQAWYFGLEDIHDEA